MAQRKRQTWPVQLADGGWRRVAIPTEYFCKYFRWHKGQKQIVFLDYTRRCWCLLIQTKRVSVTIPAADLNIALSLADSTRAQRNEGAQRIAPPGLRA